MKMAYTHTAILVYFFTNTLNWGVLLNKEKYLLNISYEKLKNKISFKQMQMLIVKNLPLPRTNK